MDIIGSPFFLKKCIAVLIVFEFVTVTVVILLHGSSQGPGTTVTLDYNPIRPTSRHRLTEYLSTAQSAVSEHSRHNTTLSAVSEHSRHNTQATLSAVSEHSRHNTTLSAVSEHSRHNTALSESATSENSQHNTALSESAASENSQHNTALSESAVSELSRHKTTQPDHGRGYVLELDASDQLTGGARNILGLQCLLAKVSSQIVLVEPFVVNSTMGAFLLGDHKLLAKENNVKLTDIYDNGTWVRYTKNRHYSGMVSWKDFVENAPRDLILVQHQWEICDTKALKEKFSPFFKLFHFRVVRELCLLFRETGVLSLDVLKRKMYGNLSPTNVTVVIDRMCGIGMSPDQYAFAVNVSQCTKGQTWNPLINTINPSKRVTEDATTYIDQYLGGDNNYISVMVRLEHTILQHGNDTQGAVQRCLDSIAKEWNVMKAKSGLNRTFLTLDTGRFGSREFHNNQSDRGNNTLTKQHVKSFFKLLYGNSTSLEEWERSFEDVSGVSNEGYIAALQRVVASRGRCLILGGGGSFQDVAMRLYRGFWNGKDKLCYTRL